MRQTNKPIPNFWVKGANLKIIFGASACTNIERSRYRLSLKKYLLSINCDDRTVRKIANRANIPATIINMHV